MAAGINAASATSYKMETKHKTGSFDWQSRLEGGRAIWGGETGMQGWRIEKKWQGEKDVRGWVRGRESRRNVGKCCYKKKIQTRHIWLTGYADGGRDEGTEGTLVVRRIRRGEEWEGGRGWHLPRRPGKCDYQKCFFRSYWVRMRHREMC